MRTRTHTLTHTHTPQVDALLMKHFLSAFSDEDAVAIVQHCKQAMAPTGAILLLQTLVPEPGDRGHNYCGDGVAPGARARRRGGAADAAAALPGPAVHTHTPGYVCGGGAAAAGGVHCGPTVAGCHGPTSPPASPTHMHAHTPCDTTC
jgi:hypothetical protein